MKSKGFTLIELLAVIVILAIIALIATPIVLNIIKGSKESATIRGAEYYLNAVELGVARNRLDNIKVEDGTYDILDTGNICLEGEVSSCTEQLQVDVKGEIPDSGTVTITNGKITNINLTYDGKTVVKEGNKLVIAGESNNNNDNNNDDENEQPKSIFTDDTTVTLKLTNGVLIATVEPNLPNLEYKFYRKPQVSDYNLIDECQNSKYSNECNLEDGYYYAGYKVVVIDEAGNEKDAYFQNTVCFVAGTKIYTETGYRNIEEIKEGEMVYALNLETNEQELKEVKRFITSQTEELYHIKIGGQVVSATPRHQFYVIDKGWVRAYDLEIGDLLVTKEGDKPIIDIQYEKLAEIIPVYNLEVDELHNYLVTDFSILVHNGSK